MVCRLRRPPGSVTVTTQHPRISTCGKVGARDSKEVARMINTNPAVTAVSPSTFGVSTYGQTSVERVAISALAGAQVSTCARVRHIGDMGLVTTVKGDFPGTSAWRPPSC